MSAEVAKLWLEETRRISKLRSWSNWIFKMGLGFAFLGFLFFVTAAIAVHIHDNKDEATCGRAGGTSLFLAFVACILISLITSRLRRSVVALDYVEGSARAGFSEKGIEQGCFLKIKLDARFPWDQFAGKWVWIGDEFQANHSDLVWACEKFGSGKKWHEDYKFPPEPKIMVDIKTTQDLRVAITLIFATQRVWENAGRLLINFGPFDQGIGRALESALKERAQERLSNGLDERLRLDESIADQILLASILGLPYRPELKQANGEKGTPYQIDKVEISDARFLGHQS